MTAVTRREAIVALAAAGGGLLLGIPSRPAAAAGDVTPTQLAAALRAYLHVTTAGEVIVTVPASEMGQGATTALPMLVAEELDVPWERVRFVQAPPDPLFGGMVTEASATTRHFFPIMRLAGATARAMLISAAAQRWGVSPSACSTEAGAVVDRQSRRQLGYGALANAAAALTPPADPPLKPVAAFRLIGKPTPFLDLASRLDGTAIYGIDVTVPGMLVGAIRSVSRIGARLGAIETASVRAMPGVRDVVTLDDAVVVVADTYWEAKRGADALVLAERGGIDADDASIDRAVDVALASPGVTASAGDRGAPQRDAVTAIARATHVVDATYRFPYLAHATMEPMNCTAWVADGRCEIWAPTQGRRTAQAAAARITGLPVERVHVHTTYLGGGFGRRSKNDFVELAVTVAARVGKPVKMIWSREEDIARDSYRPAAGVRIRLGVGADDRIALAAQVAAPSLMAAYVPETAANARFDPIAVEGLSDHPYAFADHTVGYARFEPGVPIWFWRSVSNSHNTFALECALDELARAIGRDPLALRRALLAGDDPSHAVLDRVAALAGPAPPAPRARGFALATMRGTRIAIAVDLSLPAPRTIRLHRIACAVDCGLVINPLAARAQIEGGIVWGLSAALWGRIEIRDGAAVERNFDTYPVARIEHVPPIDVIFLQGAGAPGGLGEVGAGVIAPALANALVAAGSAPVRALPLAAAGFTLLASAAGPAAFRRGSGADEPRSRLGGS